MGVIFYLSAQPAVDHYAWWQVVLRKIGHVTGYALLTGLWAWALQGAVRRPLVWAVFIALAYACTDEFHQTFVRGRDGTPRDVLVDAIGMGIAVFLIRTRRRSPARRETADVSSGRSRSSLARSP
jgi:VanZ family protein